MNSIDHIWIIIASLLVFAMQAGFLCLESGFLRSQNKTSVALKNICDFIICISIFWAFGYAIAFGTSKGGLFGTSGFFFQPNSSAGSVDETLIFIFQMMFASTACTIVSGAVAERLKFSAYLIITAIFAAFVYPFVVHWSWKTAGQTSPGGFLHELGFRDFAGSTVVHSVGGWLALVSIMIIGARTGRFQEQTTAHSETQSSTLKDSLSQGRLHVERREHFSASNIPLAMLGAFLLWFGWAGFNGGSSLALNSSVPGIILVTFIAGVAGGLTILGVSLASKWLTQLRTSKNHGSQVPEFKRVVLTPEKLINGILAGLVSVTAACHVISLPQAFLIASIGAVVFLGGAKILEQLKIDDAIGAVPVHLFAGIWGTLAVALFADLGKLASHQNRLDQFYAQLAGILVIAVFTCAVSSAVLLTLNRFWKLRVSLEDESLGLDFAEHHVRSESFELLEVMALHKRMPNTNLRATENPHTEVGQIGVAYNLVLDKIKEQNEVIAVNAGLVSMGEMAASIAHDISTPLSTLDGQLEILIKRNKIEPGSPSSLGSEQNPDLIVRLEKAKKSSGRIEKIVRSVRTLSRQGAKDPFEPVALGELVTEVIDLLEMQLKNSNIRIHTQIEEKLTLDCRSVQLYQVLLNLIKNSKDALLENEKHAEKWIRIEALSINSHAIIRVIDSGKPVSVKVAEQMNKAFFTTKGVGKGTGLGLYICQKILNEHGGKLNVRTDLEHMTIEIILPINQSNGTLSTDDVQAS